MRRIISRSIAAAALAGGLALLPPLAGAAVAGPATSSALASRGCERPYYDVSDNRVHVFCTGPGIADLHVKCLPGIWRDAQTNITNNGRVELSLGCGVFAIWDYYAELS